MAAVGMAMRVTAGLAGLTAGVGLGTLTARASHAQVAAGVTTPVKAGDDGFGMLALGASGAAGLGVATLARDLAAQGSLPPVARVAAGAALLAGSGVLAGLLFGQATA